MILPQANLWAAYIARFGAGLTQQEVGAKAGVDQATVGRWLRGVKAPTEAANVAAVAQAFDRNPLEAFVAAGFLTVDEAGRGLEDDSRQMLSEMRQEITVRQLDLRVARVASKEIRARARRGEIMSKEARLATIKETRRKLEIDDGDLAASVEATDEERVGKHRRSRRRDVHLSAVDDNLDAVASTETTIEPGDLEE